MERMKARKWMGFLILGISTSLVVWLGSLWGSGIRALPPLEDIPEEILRTEIITAARSPIDGKRLTAAEYAQLQTQLQKIPPPKLDSKVRDQIYLLRIRKTLLQFFPFLSI
jgi:hypothetical protein